MQVTIKYFASLRELMGESSRIINIDEKSSVDDIWQLLKDSKQVEFDNVMATVNMEYVKNDKELKEGDEVAFFPPVTGG
ncbi:MAG: molybdopterin converting factor subunit 1 [Pseudomonadota bacterium]|jgi:molybdopterin converting factor subunit 1|nr:molybdopterin converting factor subunit 1 [Pseudomonadota bacterium]|tara:strand:+ start:5102 stop:5338 length:237 start_codon:yes stop_codon:yes gene_type:complete